MTRANYAEPESTTKAVNLIPNSDALDDRDLAYETSRWQRILWREAANTMGGSEVETVVQGLAERPDGLKLPREIFSRLYGRPKAKPPAEMKAEDRWASAAHEALDELPEWKQARERCSGDEAWAAMTTIHVTQAALKAIPAPTDEEKALRLARDHAEGLWGLAGLGADVPEADLEAANQAVKDAEEALAKQPPPDPSALRQAFREAIEDANEEIDSAEAAVSALGGGMGPGGSGYGSGTGAGGGKDGVDRKAKMALARRVKDDPDLKKIMEEAGRLRRLHAERRATKAVHTPEELCDIENGGDIGRLLPHELMALKHPKLKWLLFQRITERTALQYKLKGTERKSKGPIVVCIDESGSMSGTPNVWAKAVSLAMLSAADTDRRGWGLIRFDDRVVGKTYAPAGEKRNTSAILDALSAFSGGGTDWQAPLKAARKVITSEAAKGLRDADIILITDGMCGLEPEFVRDFNAWLEETGTTLYTVLIGNFHRGAGYGPIEEIADKIVTLNALQRGGQERDAAFVDDVLGGI